MSWLAAFWRWLTRSKGSDMSDDFSGVTAAVSPSSGLVDGAKTPFTITISGQDVQTTQVSETVTATLSLKAADGATGTLTVPMTMTKNVATPQSTIITGCTDNQGRTYTVAANGLSVSAAS